MEEVRPLEVKRDTEDIRRMVHPLLLVLQVDRHALLVLLVTELLELLFLQPDWQNGKINRKFHEDGTCEDQSRK
jgi:hypothetical protein